MSVRWSYSRRGSLPWAQFARGNDCLSILSSELTSSREQAVEIRVFGGTVLGFWWTDSPAGSSQQMQLHLPDLNDPHARCDGVAVVFALGESERAGQLELPLGTPSAPSSSVPSA